MSRILITGIATLDVINTVAEYPAEDSEVRALQQRIVRGGNAANSACLLGDFGHAVEFVASIADDGHADFIRQDLARHRVGLQYSHTCKGRKTPASYITLNRKNGSRTIVHYRDLAEYSAKRFMTIPVEEFDWFHFEGRNIDDVRQMMQRVQAQRIDQPVSLEIEKRRDGIDSLIPLADVVLFSRAYAQALGFDQAETFLQHMHAAQPAPFLICTWAEQGAWAMDMHGDILHTPAFVPPQVVDTLGAGDTFNAGFIDAMCNGRSLAEALQAGCRLAGKKVGQTGFDNLAEQQTGGTAT